MPIHEYHCAKCGAIFDHLARTRGDIPERCAKCGKKGGLQRQLSTFSAATRDPAPSSACNACPSMSGCPNAGGCGGCMDD